MCAGGHAFIHTFTPASIHECDNVFIHAFIPAFIHKCVNACLRECMNALMKIKRWILGTVSELGLEDWEVEGRTFNCLKQDLQDFRIGRIGNPFHYQGARPGDRFYRKEG